jgi:hypothetical protein
VDRSSGYNNAQFNAYACASPNEAEAAQSKALIMDEARRVAAVGIAPANVGIGGAALLALSR